MADIEQAIAATSSPRKAECPACEGEGDLMECGEQIGPCTNCRTTGAVDVGVFDPICAHHCHLCEGQDHHWSYDGRETFDGEPLMSCRHCPALRLFTQDDDQNCDY